MSQLHTVLLSTASPLMCLWADLILNDMLSEDSTINVHDVLGVVQLTLALLGNGNTLLTQM